MNLFGKIKRIFNLGLNDEKAWNTSLWNLRGSQSLSGETVTEETALTYSAVWNAITLISGTVGSLPLHLMQKQGQKKRVADDDPLYRVLHDQPNPYMTAMAFRETMTSHILTWGNCYAEKVINGIGEVIALWPIPPNRILNIQMMENDLWYEIRLDKESKWFPRGKILHRSSGREGPILTIRLAARPRGALVVSATGPSFFLVVYTFCRTVAAG